MSSTMTGYSHILNAERGTLNAELFKLFKLSNSSNSSNYLFTRAFPPQILQIISSSAGWA